MILLYAVSPGYCATHPDILWLPCERYTPHLASWKHRGPVLRNFPSFPTYNETCASSVSRLCFNAEQNSHDRLRCRKQLCRVVICPLYVYTCYTHHGFTDRFVLFILHSYRVRNNRPIVFLLLGMTHTQQTLVTSGSEQRT